MACHPLPIWMKAALRRWSWPLAGLMVLADWLGSDSAYFPYQGQLPAAAGRILGAGASTRTSLCGRWACGPARLPSMLAPGGADPAV